MLAVPGQNPLGNVIHVIVGPESEFFMDIHGAKIMEVTSLLQQLDTSSPVYISLTRCNSEVDTAVSLKRAEVPFWSSFSPDKLATMRDKAQKLQPPATKQQVAPKQGAAAVQTSGKANRCDLCAQPNIKVIELDGYQVCEACASIEIHRSQNRQVDAQIKSMDLDNPSNLNNFQADE